ncbi:VOC family protein [Geomicrobium sediminis]|uniref:Lactoylglutathione lyase n=1 Tax=Geomicrobium sediminis TaxID=1347788 RepID=A0ABS2PGE6_9BACL|nr:VOC family protein [Geomicrobium sediminis]MBM7634156.1 lactoylglutathione lyase [Geomicrobium sediminis]
MIKKIEHVALVVNDLAHSIEFYHRCFGFNVRLKGENETREMAFLYLENEPGVEIELIRDKVDLGNYETKSVINHIAFTVERLDEEVEKLKEKGVTFLTDTPKPTLDGGTMILFHGPDKELLQLVERGTS